MHSITFRNFFTENSNVKPFDITNMKETIIDSLPAHIGYNSNGQIVISDLLSSGNILIKSNDLNNRYLVDSILHSLTFNSVPDLASFFFISDNSRFDFIKNKYKNVPHLNKVDFITSTEFHAEVTDKLISFLERKISSLLRLSTSLPHEILTPLKSIILFIDLDSFLSKSSSDQYKSKTLLTQISNFGVITNVHIVAISNGNTYDSHNTFLDNRFTYQIISDRRIQSELWYSDNRGSNPINIMPLKIGTNQIQEIITRWK